MKGVKKLLHHDRNTDHPIGLLHFAGHLPQVLNTLNWETFVVASHTAMYWICGTTTVFCTSLSSTVCKMTNSTHQTPVLSRPLLTFGFSSCPFLHPCSSINPTVHHLFSNHHSSSFSESISIPTHCNCASTSRQWFGKFFFVVSLDWFFAQAMLDTGHKAWALYGSRSCAPHWWREPRWQSASLLVSSSKSLSGLSTNFCS